MPQVKDMLTSNYLRKEDLDNPTTVTITRFIENNVAMEGKPQEMKWCMSVREFENPLVLNKINIQLLEAILKSSDTDDWVGKKVVLYNDPSIMFGGKLVGGIRIQAARQGSQTAEKPMMQPSVSDVNRKLQEAADDADYLRSNKVEEF